MGVRSSWLMLARNCDLCWLASSAGAPSREFTGARFDLLLQAGVRFLELGRHVVERLGEGFQLVIALDVDAVLQGSAPIWAAPACKVRMGVTTLRARNRLTSTASPRPRSSSTALRSSEA